MLTSLRIDDTLYRAAKAEAAKEGVTITKFLSEAIKLRLVWDANKVAQAIAQPKAKIVLPVYQHPKKSKEFSLDDFHKAEDAYWNEEALRLRGQH